MGRSFGLVSVIAVVCGLGTGSATAAEGPEPPLAFAETDALQTTCAKLAAGVNVPIRNETAARQRVRLIAVEFKDSGKAAVGRNGVCGGLSVKVPPRLRGGRGATATLRAKKRRRGEFSGSLLLFATKGRVVRREVAIAPKNPSKTLAATPLLDSATEALGKSDRGPIWIPVEGSVGALPRPPAKGALTVGAVSGANGGAAVVYGGRGQLDGLTANVKLELADGLQPGAYAGTVDLNPDDDEKGDVALELKVAASWEIAAALLLAGILLALLLQRFTGSFVPRFRLRTRIRGLSERHQKLVEALTDFAAEGKNWGKFRIEDVESLREGLEKQLSNATRDAVIQIDKKVLDSLESAVTVVEAQIDLLKEIPRHGSDLEKELQKLAKKRPEGFTPPAGIDRANPALDAEARKALVGSEVKADQLKPCIEEIDARAKQVRILQGLEGRLADLSDATRTLKTVDNPEVTKLDTKLTAISYLLWTAETAEDLETAAEEIQNTAKAIAELWHELEQTSELPASLLRAGGNRPGFESYMAFDWQPELVSERAVVIANLEVPPGAPSSPSAPPSLPAAPPPPQLDAEAAEDEARRALWGQCLAFVLAAFVAVATGLIALYAPNDTWGSEWDYLAAAIWGLGVQATVSTLATSLDGLGLLRRG
jgi:hypothetical protein